VSVLVTGAAGFLGSYIMAALAAAGRKACGFDRRPADPPSLAVAPCLAETCIQGELSDAALLQRICLDQEVEAIVHTAGLVGLDLSLSQPAATYAANVMGFVNLCEAARGSGAKRLVLLSSNAVYHGPLGEKLVETDPVFSVERGNPAAHYGTSKMAQEAIALAYATFHDLDVLTLRVSAIYGFGMRTPMYIKPMVEDAVCRRPTRFSSGGPMKRDYTYVLDCADAVMRALAAPRERPGPRILNVAAGQAITAADVACVVRKVLPDADIEIGDGLSPVETANMRMRASLDVSAARTVLDWQPAWTIEAGISDYAARFRQFIDINSQ